MVFKQWVGWSFPVLSCLFLVCFGGVVVGVVCLGCFCSFESLLGYCFWGWFLVFAAPLYSVGFVIFVEFPWLLSMDCLGFLIFSSNIALLHPKKLRTSYRNTLEKKNTKEHHPPTFPHRKPPPSGPGTYFLLNVSDHVALVHTEGNA